MVLFCQQQQQQQQPSSISHEFSHVSHLSSTRVSGGTLGSLCDSVACSSFRALLSCCREVLLVLFCQQQQQRQRQQPSSIAHEFCHVSQLVLVSFRRNVRQFFGAILCLVRPSFSDYLHTYRLIYLFIYLSICLPVCLSISLPIYLPTYLSSCLVF